ncbi:MAG TPA: lysine--tRNA ligase [Nitrososphaeraceae archaeon]|nr:lysine--tRNA ligase [Nitrososphaeraceae archaeon]
MNREVIGRGTWIDKIASTIINREKDIGRSLKSVLVESGLGASGFPHIGSLGDAVRAYGVSLAIKNLGYDSKLIAYSDDLDGLRKIPTGLPEWLRGYIGKPVSNIPDPVGQCHDSFGAHMGSLLLDALDKLGINYQFLNAANVYGNGMLTNQIDSILSNAAKLGNKIEEIVGQSKYKESLPYFPICESCGRLYVAHAEKYITEERKVSYKCNGTKLGNNNVKGCGYTGEVPISAGKGKLAWKVEFAARWSAFDIRFEAYGKDIMDSVRVNDWVSDVILNYAHPLHVKYEMFLDKGGKKISKSTGNVLTPQVWLRYGTPQSLLLLLFKRITGTRQIGIDDIVTLMEEYDACEDIYFGKKKEGNEDKLIKTKGLYEYVNHLKPTDKSPQHVPYTLMSQQASFFSGAGRIKKIFDRLLKYKVATHLTPDLEQKIQLACNWSDDHLLTEKFDVILTEKEKMIIRKIVDNLESAVDANSDIDAEKIQQLIYETSKQNQVQPRNIFKLMYRMLINADSGPRLGGYITDLGLDRMRSIIDSYVS